MGKFQTGQAMLQRHVGQACQQKAALCHEFGPLHPASIQAVHGLNYKTVYPLVRHQQIGTIAQEKGHHPQLPGRVHSTDGLLFIFGQGHQTHRASQTEGGVTAHILMLPQFQLRAAEIQFFLKLFKTIHAFLQLIQNGKIPILRLFYHYTKSSCKIE